MQHVFIAYKHRVKILHKTSSEDEKQPVLPHSQIISINTGEEWRTAIDLAIKNVFALIIIITPEAKTSEC
jgi:hypothetical protein